MLYVRINLKVTKNISPNVYGEVLLGCIGTRTHRDVMSPQMHVVRFKTPSSVKEASSANRIHEGTSSSATCSCKK